ncbi:hypothetical protein TcWFU_010492 [Taenia crassiceps]|uniref:Uncharacterized protein n=1 Tax=Taenia crassiceps TaxID=6207 RepID=A0ABR4Q8V3_9CEST
MSAAFLCKTAMEGFRKRAKAMQASSTQHATLHTISCLRIAASMSLGCEPSEFRSYRRCLTLEAIKLLIW